MKITTIPTTAARLVSLGFGVGVALALAACAQDAAGPGPLGTAQPPAASSAGVPPDGEAQAQQPGSPVQ